jgi:predicted transcriptional regulator
MANWREFKQEMNAVIPGDELEAVDALAALQAERIRQGLSQRDLAQKIGMKQPQLAKLERLDSSPTLSTLNRYAAGLGLKLKLMVTV